MKKSQCYRIVRNPATKANEYVLTPSYLEVFEYNGKEIKIHFHRIEVAPKVFKWSATEESTALKCTPDYDTKQACYEAVQGKLEGIITAIARCNTYIEKLRDYKEKNNIK